YATRHLPVTATVTRVGDGAMIALHPRDGADHALWLTVTSWQGGGLDVDRLRETSPGVFHTTRPMPIGGQWQTMVRLHSGSALTARPTRSPRHDAAARPPPADPRHPVRAAGAADLRRARLPQAARPPAAFVAWKGWSSASTRSAR